MNGFLAGLFPDADARSPDAVLAAAGGARAKPPLLLLVFSGDYLKDTGPISDASFVSVEVALAF